MQGLERLALVPLDQNLDLPICLGGWRSSRCMRVMSGNNPKGQPARRNSADEGRGNKGIAERQGSWLESNCRTK